MNPAAPLKPIAWLMTALKPALNDEPVVMRADAGNAHRFRKVAGKIVVELNPYREKECGQRFAAIEKARDDKVNSAGSVREQKLKDARAVYDAAVAAIEKEHREIASIASAEFEQSEQQLLGEFSQAPAVAG